MITVTKTDTHGFRAERFRNQIVHQYYGHLQSVMHSIEPSDKYKNLFARPEIDGFSTDNTNIEWTSSLSGKPVHYSQLSDLDKQKVDGFIEEAFSRISRYVADGRDKTGKEHDYSQFLSIVGKKPNPNQIWIVGGKPTIVQWGYSDDNNLMGSSGIYPNWDSFINEIKTIQPEEKAVAVEAPIVEKPVEPETPPIGAATVVASPLFTDLPDEEPKKNEAKPEAEPKVESKEIKPVAKPKKPVKKQEEKKTAMAGLGGYWWVKWLAIILLIIIIILLLLRFIPHAQNPFGQMAGMAGGPTIINGGAGGIGGGPNGGAGGIGGPDGSAGGQEGGAGIGQGNGGNSSEGSSASMKKSNPCKSCGGSGIRKAGSKCSSCNGRGKTASGASCSQCDGTGKYQRTGKCTECTGSGIAGSSSKNSYGNDTDIDTDNTNKTDISDNSNKSGITDNNDNSINTDNTDNTNTTDSDDDDFDIADDNDSDNQNDVNKGNDESGDMNGSNTDSDDAGRQNDSDEADNSNGDSDYADNSAGIKSDEGSGNTSSEDLCPVCKCLFSQHSPEDLKKCLLSAQEGKEEMKKRLQKFANEFGENATDIVGD